MNQIEEVTSGDRYHQPLLKKWYVIMFLFAFAVLIFGFIVISLMSFIPRPSYSDPGYEDYQNLVRMSSGLAKLLIEVGLGFLSASSFLGALADNSLSENVKKGMMIASGISILGLVIVFIFPGLYIY